jgi:hypothetical protein
MQKMITTLLFKKKAIYFIKSGKYGPNVIIAQFFSRKQTRASRQVCWPGAEQANKLVGLLVLHYLKQADKFVSLVPSKPTNLSATSRRIRT